MRKVLAATAAGLALQVMLVHAHAAPPGPITTKAIATRLSNPTYVTHAHDSLPGETRLFITLQDGRILIYQQDASGARILSQPFLDLRGRVSTCFNCGLLSMAFDPAYAQNAYLYVFYTDVAYPGRTWGPIVVERYSASSRNVADPSSGVRVLTIQHADFEDHFGGQLQFGPNGYLYISTGDGGRSSDLLGGAGDPYNRAQNPARLLGKILRLDVGALDGGAYAIPPDNPFVGDPPFTPCTAPDASGVVTDDPASRTDPCPEIWAFGLRNPWRFSFDRRDPQGSGSRDLFIGDVGQSQQDEVNFEAASSPGGLNYGWRCYEGNLPYADPVVVPPDCTDTTPSRFTFPVHANSIGSTGDCSLTGGYRYRGAGIGAIAGKYLFADWCSGRIYSLVQNPDGTWRRDATLLDTPYRIVSFGEDYAGELYIVHHDATRGAVYKIVPGAKGRP